MGSPFSQSHSPSSVPAGWNAAELLAETGWVRALAQRLAAGTAQDPDDLEPLTVKFDQTAYQRRIRAKTCRPQLVAQHGDLRTVDRLVGFREVTSKDRIDSEHR